MNPVELLGTLTALVGIYLLLSLIGTAFSELLVTRLGLRGETLDKVVDSILGRDLADRFFDHAKIASLSEASPLGSGSQWLTHLFFGSGTAATIRRRAAGGTAVPMRRPSEVPPETFADVALELALGKSWQNTATDTVGLRQLLDEKLAQAGQTAGTEDEAFIGQLQAWAATSTDCGSDLPAQLTGWFNDVNARALGWFKRRITRSLLIIGLLIALATNGDSLQLFQRLSEDPAARQQALALSQRLIEGSTIACSAVDPKADPAAAASCLRQIGDATPSAGAPEHCAKLAEARPLADEARVRSCLAAAPAGLMVTVSPRLGSCDDGKALPKDVLRCYAGELSPLLGWDGDPLLALKAPAILRWNRGGESLLKWLRILAAKGVGLLITAGAISLGAPFWFDLLQKLVAARKALSGGADASASDAAVAVTTPAPAATSGAAGATAHPAGSVQALVSIAESSRYSAGLTRFAPDARDFDLANAYWLGVLAMLAYEDGPKVISACSAMGLEARPFSGKADNTGLSGKLPEVLRSVDTQGFIAWDRRNCFIVFRGTEQNPQDWLTDLNSEPAAFAEAGRSTPVSNPAGLVHHGFLNALHAVWQVSAAGAAGGGLGSLLDGPAGIDGGGRQLWFAGHSLGGALAVLAAREIGDWAQARNTALRKDAEGQSMAVAEQGTRRLYGALAGVYTYGQPRVGDAVWIAAAERAFGARWQRFVNASDVVPRVPLRAMGYADGGQVRYFDEQGRLYERPDAWFRWLDTVILNEGSLVERGKVAAANHAMSLYLSRVDRYAGIGKAGA